MKKIIMLAVITASLVANERLNKPAYRLDVSFKKSDVVIKLPFKCNKFFPTFGNFSEACVDGVNENNVVAETSLDGTVFVDGVELRWANFSDELYLSKASIENNQTVFESDINLRQIIHVYNPGPFKKYKIEGLYPYLKSVKVTVGLIEIINEKDSVVKQWRATLTKKNSKLKISLPELKQGIIEANTYNIDNMEECIDGKVWIKKYGKTSGDTCEWKAKNDRKTNI